jgi:acyl carrier protein
VTEEQIEVEVREAVCEALALEPEEVTLEATLTDELGAESIDLLDVLFRIERATGVKIEAAALADYIQGGISDDEFSDAEDVVTPLAIAHLKTIMPQIDPAELEGKLRAERVIDLFTVGNLAYLVAQRAGALATA